jgi:hypothetical protein
VIQDVWSTQPDEICKFKTRDIEMMKPELTTHRTRISKIGERTDGKIIDYFNGMTIGE